MTMQIHPLLQVKLVYDSLWGWVSLSPAAMIYYIEV